MIVSALSDDEIEVREYVYRALIEFSTGNLSCVHALVAADYPAILINQLRTARKRPFCSLWPYGYSIIVFILAAGLKVP